MTDTGMENTEGVQHLVKDFALRTTSHGVARIAASNTRFRRTAWMVVVLGAFIGYSLHVGSLIARYLQYDVAVKMEVVSGDSITFPAVTVCNSNKLRLSAILNSTYKDLAKVNEPLFSFTYRGPCMPGDVPCDEQKSKCIKQYMWCNGIVDCPNAIDELNCQRGNCLSNQFKCNNGKCLPLTLKCNFRDDCGDNSDELLDGGCTIRNCVEGEYMCSTFECIPQYKLCDDKPDCADGSDEIAPCTLYKASIWFSPCKGGFMETCIFSVEEEYMCLHPSDVCNGVVDCFDGTDEICDNWLKYNGTMWTCENNSSSIPIQLMCNGFPNCNDGSDEVNCEDYPCPPGMFKCAVTYLCVDETKRCDGSNDCVEVMLIPFDLSDEENCENYDCLSDRKLCSNKDGNYCLDNTSWCDGSDDCFFGEDEECYNYTCPPNMIKCGLLCEVLDKRCDLKSNCLGGIDEADCQNHMCPDDSYFRCRSGQCIPRYLYCDEPIRPDCADGSDELFCNNTCDNDEFQCKSGWCINGTYTCDGVNDCGDNSDEDNCPTFCESGEFKCESGFDNGNRISTHCIPMNRQCDRFIDCHYEDDEAGCEYHVRDVTTEPDWNANYLDISDDPTVYEAFRRYVFVNRPTDFIPREYPPLWDHFLVSSNTADFSDLKTVLRLQREELKQFGHQGSDLILQCSYDQRECNPLDFYQFEDDVYGNCYTFNHEQQRTLLNATNTGSGFGLKLTLFTEQSEYIGIFGQESGIRLMVHDPFTTPFLENEGIDARTGTATSVIIKQKEFISAPWPWGNCTDKKYVDSGEYRYSLIACQKECLHLRMYDKCGCVDSFFEDKPLCDILDKEQDACVQLMYYFYQKGNLGCDCQQPCSVTKYDKILSLTTWPSSTFSPRLLSSLLAVNPKVGTIAKENQLSANLARVKIYFESLNFERVLEVEDYPFPQLMADVGGALGLWVGLSLITVVEFAEFIYELLRSCRRRSKQRNDKNDNGTSHVGT
uniref:Uncharacterized protein LOC100370225 n=1 Tax=Saccoglossus kowalevskii TaxID=10224 RepID=A0ABM0MJ78_SACKO|nr:PREDICTED: uncharacterized protein LOC100370225 [Saccoglossus kowalevskii]